MGYTQKNKTPLIYLNPPSKSRPSTPVLVQCFGGGVRGRFRVWVQFSATQLWAEVIMCCLHLSVICNMGWSKPCETIITCKWNLISVAQHPCLFRQNLLIENKGHWIGRCMVRAFFLSCNTICLHCCEKLKHLFIISFSTWQEGSWLLWFLCGFTLLQRSGMH